MCDEIDLEQNQFKWQLREKEETSSYDEEDLFSVSIRRSGHIYIVVYIKWFNLLKLNTSIIWHI